jgi:hypothetical protein
MVMRYTVGAMQPAASDKRAAATQQVIQVRDVLACNAYSGQQT